MTGQHRKDLGDNAPDSSADWPVPTDGVLGNASLWDVIVVLDLTARILFGVIR